MAIKFSQFVVQTDASTLSHVVGYNGVDNIQITPTNFLNSLLTGTAGQVLYYDTTGVAGENAFFWDNTDKRLGIGTNTPSYRVHIKDNSVTTGSKTLLQLQSDPINNGGSLNLDFRVSSANTDDRYVARISGMREGNGALSQLQFWTESSGLNQRMTITSAGNVGIGTATPTSKLEVDGDMSVTAGGVILLPDNSFLRFGTSADATIYHDATDTYFKNFTGNLILQNNKDDADIIFQSDDGSGGVTEYFRVDGGNTNMVASKNIIFNDSVKASFGNSEDLKILHNGTDSVIINERGNLDIQQRKDDADIIFSCDDGSGGTTEYFKVDGGAEQVIFSKEIKLLDDVVLKIGGGGDLRILHSSGGGGAGYIQNYTGDLQIQNRATDKDVLFRADDGSGVVTTYFYLDGGRSDGSNVATRFPDGSIILLGSGTGWNDGSQIYHNGTNSYWNEYVGNIEISCNTTDGDIIFRSDDGSGGLAEYFRLDGSRASGSYTYTTRPDGGVITFGDTLDLRLWHDPNTNESYMRSYNNNLYIESVTADKDILFRADDGSGGTTEYFRVDGGATNVVFSKDIYLNDDIRVRAGTGGDFSFFHNGSNSKINNNTGNIEIENFQDDGDIIFKSDDGSGGTAQYFRVDGGSVETQFLKSTLHFDSVKAKFGDSGDLQIYHNGSNSYIQDAGTGSLKILAQDLDINNAAETASMIRAIDGAQVELYYGGGKKLETKSTGINIQGVTEYANNTAALAGGLVVGDVYRTGDDLKIVH